MNRSYDDIESVTRLLEEKERDLELTAQIGKGLLQQNQLLENKISELETEIKTSNEHLAQLSHEIQQKNELIGVLTSDLDDLNSENGSPNVAHSINLDLLHKKIAELEEENKSLRQEQSQFVKETTEVEEQEKKLMSDISHQLYTTTTQFEQLQNELERSKEENQLQHDQIVVLTSRLTDAELRLHQLTTENEEQCSLLCITKENQNLLALELVDFKTKYQEVVSLLNETQEQLRRAKKRVQPTGRICPPATGSTIIPKDCLEYELLHETTFSDNSLDSGISLDRTASPVYKNVFETVRCVSRTNTFDNSGFHLGAMAMCSATQPMISASVSQRSVSSYSCKGTSSVFSNSNYSSLNSNLKERTSSKESLFSESEESFPPQSSSGIPGVPGAKDLEAALKRLTPAEVLARRAMLSHAPLGTYTYEENPAAIPLGCRTPDSIMSTGRSSVTNLSSQQWRLPEKLQIIKPMEGSQTLGHWSKLATPTLGGLLEERPGVTIRGGRGLDDLGLQTYSLSDVEEDVEDHPGKRFQASNCIYTFTNSTVMHPDDGTLMFSVPQSQTVSQITSQNSSRQSSAPPTPRHSRRNSCSTFSVSLCLASMLNERGIKAVTPSALNTPCGQNFTPTVTPCNSPEGSPPRSISPEPQFLTGLLTSGADLLRRKIIGEAEKQQYRARNKITLSKLERRALKSIKILEKVENIGLDNIISTTNQQNVVSPLSFPGSSQFYSTHSRSASPMARLTSLKNLAASDINYKSDDVRIDREAIKAILSKGLSSDSLKSLSSSSENSSISPTTPTENSNSSVIAARDVSKMNDQNSARLKQMQRQKSRRNLINGRQRPDLGKLGNSSNMRPDLGTVANSNNNNINNNNHINPSNEEKSQPMGFVGTISSLLFGRKGGLL